MIKRGDKLKCIQLQAAWWGTIYDPGNYYRVVDVVNYKRTYVDPKHEKEYWAHNQIMMKIGSEMVELHKKIVTNQGIEDIELAKPSDDKNRWDFLSTKQKQLRDIINKWELKIELPFCIIKSEMNNSDDSFLITKKSEIFDMIGTTKFQTTTYFLEEYFDMTAIYRDEKLKKLGI